ncbi:MAG: 50S ribosomal protein L9 [Acholeplasma sp.]|nr:50S ribosomal protein L9 [Acholeplasma sp.]
MKRILGLILSIAGFIISGVIAYQSGAFNDKDFLLYYIMIMVFVSLIVVSIEFILNHNRKQKIKSLNNRLTAWSSLSYHVKQIGDEAFNELPIGILLYDKDTFTVKWSNPYSNKVFGFDIENHLLKELNPAFETIMDASNTSVLFTIGDKKYDAISSQKNQVIYLFDVTTREEIKDKYQSRSTALGVLYLDNVEEALSGFDIYEKSNIRGEYLGIITDWIQEHKGYLKLYTEDRMVIAIHYEELQKVIVNKFEILNRIREVSSKHRIRVSASIGIASWEVSFEELGTLAQNAIELAEKRGGDQAVVNIQNEKIAYFGGKSNASEKSSRVQVRVQSQNFRELIENASNLVIIGHKQADIDALGAMIGVFRMAVTSKIEAKIVFDLSEMDNTIKKILPYIKEEDPELFKSFTESKDAIKAINDNTLVVIVDTQSPNIIANIDVYNQAKKVAVIDHHRHGENTFEGEFMYVEPYASSSVELIAEMMEFYQKDIDLLPIEATIMYGGILVDTNVFSYRTGMRTFGAAAYLKEHEASSVRVKEWLRLDLDRTLLINELLQSVTIVTKGFAVVFDQSNEIRDRVLLAQVSERILDIEGVKAGFTIARVTEDSVGISARSYDEVNVQVIMEEMGGGGHLNSAATQIKDQSIESIFDSLKTLLLREHEEGDERMKVILIEDVKGRGKKDDIIDVANGYGQFLLSSAKAISATDENIKALENEKQMLKEREAEHLALMNKLKQEIESQSVTIHINMGSDGKLFGSVTTKQVVEAFEDQTGIRLDKKKVELTSEINSVGIYTATVSLHKDVKAQFEINVLEK